MPKSQDSQNETTPPRRKRRRWLKILGILLILLVALGLAINGPIARWLVGKILTDQLAKQGLEGSVKVEGQLWSGFTLKEASFDGGDSIVRLKFDELGVHYSLPELRDKKIRRVDGKGLVLEINLKEKPEEENGKKPEFDKIIESLQKIRPLVAPLELDLERFDITLNPFEKEKKPLKLSFTSLQHEAGSETFQLAGLASNLLGEQGLPQQDLILKWEENGMHLSEFKVLPALVVNEAQISYPAGEPLSLAASVRAGGADLDLAADATGTIELKMKNGPLDVGDIVSAYDPELRLDGTISRLEVTARNLWDGTDNWTARIDLDGTDLQWPGGGGLAEVSLRVTGDENIKLIATATNDLTLDATAPRPDLKSGSPEDGWKNLPVAFELGTPSLHQTLLDVFAAIGTDPPELDNIPQGAVTLTGNLTTGGELGIAPADLAWTFSDIAFQKKEAPNLKGTARLADGVAHVTATLAEPRPEETVELGASWTLESKSYDGSLTLEVPDPAWLDPFIPGTTPEWRPTGPISLTWSGKGSFPKDEPALHAGEVEVTELTLTAPEDTTTEIALKGTYAWPGNVELSSLTVRNNDLALEGEVKWVDDRVTIESLHLLDQTGPLAHLSGSLPLTTETLSPKKFFAQKEKIDLELEAKNLRLRRLAGLLPLSLPDGFAASLSTNLTVGGTPSDPLLGGTITATEVDTPGPEQLPLLSAQLNLSTAERTLKASGEITEPDGRVVSLDASLPLEIDRLLNDPEEFKKLPIQARATISEFALQRLQIVAPPLADALGSIDAEFRVGGTVNKPVLSGGATVTLERYPLPPGLPQKEIGPSKLVLRLDGDRIVIDRSPITTSGGTVVLTGTVGLADGAPVLDLQANAESVLVWRDDNVLVRSNGLMTLKGPLETAAIRGDLRIIESLIYHDIEILPIGVPATGAPKPKLPKIDRATADRLAGIPEPFRNWTLDVGIATADPILIRGNIATGRVTADTRIRGTIGKPQPSGSVNLEKVQASLPLSKLSVREGKLVFRPEQPFDPVIDVRGTTSLNNYRISLYFSGPISNPKYDLFSDPPLPESEILTLLATGTTTGGLQDQDTATMKAFQFGVNELKRRLTKPGSDSFLQRFLETLEVVDIRVGENDPFRGRKFTSATLQLNNFLFFSAAVDREGHTRGVVMFAPQPDDPEARGILDEARKALNLGAPSNIKVTGLRTIRPETALTAIAGRLEYISARSPNASRANDAAFLLERFLQQQGFTDPTVGWSIPQPDRIVLAVEEGPHSSLGKIFVRGLTEDVLHEEPKSEKVKRTKLRALYDGVRKQMQAAHQGRTRLPGEDLPYLPENNTKGLANATAFLNSEGYWAARVELASADRDSRGLTNINILAVPGPHFHIAPVSVDAGTLLREELLARLNKFLPGRVAKTGNINLARNSAGRFYRDKGYQNAEVSMKARHEGGFTYLSFSVTLGRRFTVDDIMVVGLERTNPDIVARRFDQLSGETYDRKEFDDQIRKLFGTGAFTGIRLEERPKSDGTMDVTLHLREGKPDGYQFYAGAGSFEGYILGAGYYHRNIFGNLWNLSTRAELSGIGLLGEAGVTDPFFLGYDLRFTPRAFLQTRTYEGYSKFESGAGVSLEWDVTDHYAMTLDWTTSFVTLSSDGLPNPEVGPNNYLLNVLGLTQTYDRRDNIAVPTDGFYAQLLTDVGFSFGERPVSFVRAEAHASVYEPITSKSHVAVGARAGVILPNASDSELPVDLRYFLGGANSVRSFRARELGPEAANGIPRGGESYWVANAEYIHSILGPVNGVLFLDAGSLSRDHHDLFIGDIKYALGLGIRLNLPIGAVRLEYGRSLNPERNEPDGTFHFAIGSAF